MDKKELILILIVYLIGLSLWCLPIFKNNSPYGESDAAIHMYLAGYMAHTNTIITHNPDYILNSSWGFNDPENVQMNPNNFLIYAPPMHTWLAMIIKIQGYEFAYVFLAIICSGIYFTIYLLMRYLYDRWIALTSAALMMFSLRNQLTYLWGQWATGISFMYTPLILLFLYKYYENKETKYIYLIFSLLTIQGLFHILGVVLSIGFMGLFILWKLIETRKLYINKHFLLGAVAFCISSVLLAPLLYIQIPGRIGMETNIPPDGSINFMSRLIGWYNIPGGYHGVPEFYFNFKNIYLSYFFLVFLVLGLLYLFSKRRDKDKIMLCSLIGMYIILHLDLIGLQLGGKYPRLFYYESIIFYPIMVLGAFKVAYFFKDKYFLLKNNRISLRALIQLLSIGSLLVLCFVTIVSGTYTLFFNAYGEGQRLNADELKAIDWMNSNLPESSYVIYTGGLTSKQQHWTQALVFKNTILFDQDSLIPSKNSYLNRSRFILFDYSYLVKYNAGQEISMLQGIEYNMTTIMEKMYDNGNYKIYRFN